MPPRRPEPSLPAPACGVLCRKRLFEQLGDLLHNTVTDKVCHLQSQVMHQVIGSHLLYSTKSDAVFPRRLQTVLKFGSPGGTCRIFYASGPDLGRGRFFQHLHGWTATINKPDPNQDCDSTEQRCQQ
jgi:hypothetical protein